MSQRKPGKREKFAAAAQARESETKIDRSVKVPTWWFLLPVITAFLVYANTLGHGFALDDYAAILENADTRKGFAAIGDIFSTSYRHGYTMIGDELYRPLPKALFAICWQLAPDSAAPGHWTNVILFAITCFVIFRSLNRWFPSHPLMALIASMLFAVHPVHTEVVANIKSLDEILSFLLGFISLDLFFRYHNEHKKRFLILGSFTLFGAFLSKESTITFLPLFPLLLWFALDFDWKKAIVSSWPVLLPTLVFFLIRHQILYSEGMFTPGPPSVADNMLQYAKDPLLRFTSAVAMLGRYLQVLLVPFPLTFDLSFPQVTPEGPGSFRFIVSAVVLTGLLVLAFWGLSKRTGWSFALLFFFVTVSVSSNIFVLIGTHYGERLMYMPSFGIVLSLAWLISHGKWAITDKPGRLSPMVIAITLPILLVYSGLTIARNPVWKDNGTLYYSGLTSAPKSVRVQYYQGLYLGKEETIAGFPMESRDSVVKAAFKHLNRATELYPSFHDAWTQLGVISFRQAQLARNAGDTLTMKKYMDNALKYYSEALRYNPYDPVVYNNSATVYFEAGNIQEAFKRFQKAVEYKPDYADALMNLGSCYGMMGQFDQAIQYFDKCIAVDPSKAQAWYFAGITWRNKGDENKAAYYLGQFERLNGKK